MKKIVLNVGIHDERDKKKAMKVISGLTGIDSITVDMKDGKITLLGNVDPVQVAGKLRKQFPTDIVSVGPAKEPEKKKEEPQKDGGKKPNAAPVPTYVHYYGYPHQNYVPPQYPLYGDIQNDHDSCVIS